LKHGAMVRLIAACEEGTVNLVITKSISRFARNTLDALNYIRKLKRKKNPPTPRSLPQRPKGAIQGKVAARKR